METKNITITDKGVKRHPRGGYGQYLAFGCVNGVEVSAHTTDSETYDWWNDDSDEEKHEEALETLDSLLLSAFENLLYDDSWLSDYLIKQLTENTTADGYLKTIVDGVRNGVDEGWSVWDAEILKDFYEDEKPDEPTDEFIKHWIESQPAEALLS